jgi:hypothetical protein
MLCGHDWSLCAPPIASSVSCPGLRPLSRVRTTFVVGRARGIQMVRVVEAEPAALVFELLGCQAFEGRLRGDRHEDGQRDGAVG